MRTALFLAAALLVPPIAAADARGDEPVPAKAKKLAQRGRELHDRGDYERAIVAFKEAYVIAPSPALLFNLAQAYRLQGNCDDASLMYRRFLRTNPDAENQRIAESHLATVERCVAKRSLNIKLDDSMAYLQKASVPSPSEAVFRDGPDPANRTSRKKLVGVGLGVAGGVGLAAAAYFGVQAASDASAVEKAYANGAKWKDIQAIDARGKRNASIATYAGIGGGAAVLAGATLYFLGRRDERAHQVTVLPTARGAQVGVAWRF